ncbi:MAG: glycerate kinase [Chloroflexi bacterium]|nr:glycerate kinase [Chloroflexota bacterium]
MTARFDERVLASPESRGQRERVLPILSAALAAVDPYEAVRQALQRNGERLTVDGETYDLARFRRAIVVGAGKAGAPMARAVEDVLGDRLTGGVVNVKRGHAEATRRVEIREAGHPLPDEAGLAGTARIAELPRDASTDDLVLCLLSGGGSALLELLPDDVSLADLQQLTDQLSRAGATIGELNAVRKHVSLVKGGGLARLAASARVVTLILSDVVGNPLDVIASGPTAPDPTTYRDALAVLDRYDLRASAPAAIQTRLEAGLRGELPETPKANDPVFARVRNVLVGSNDIATRAAVAAAEAQGFHTLLLSTYVEGEAREVGKVLAALAREIHLSGRPLPRPCCLVLGGETTVTVRGNGRGGRNQEVALGAALKLDGLPDILVASLATDGNDGPTDAAGAIADGSTLRRAAALGLDPHAVLAHNDAYSFFDALGDLLLTGPTNTNVNDLALVVAF